MFKEGLYEFKYETNSGVQHYIGVVNNIDLHSIMTTIHMFEGNDTQDLVKKWRLSEGDMYKYINTFDNIHEVSKRIKEIEEKEDWPVTEQEALKILTGKDYVLLEEGQDVYDMKTVEEWRQLAEWYDSNQMNEALNLKEVSEKAGKACKEYGEAINMVTDLGIVSVTKMEPSEEVKKILPKVNKLYKEAIASIPTFEFDTGMLTAPPKNIKADDKERVLTHDMHVLDLNWVANQLDIIQSKIQNKSFNLVGAIPHITFFNDKSGAFKVQDYEVEFIGETQLEKVLHKHNTESFAEFIYQLRTLSVHGHDTSHLIFEI